MTTSLNLSPPNLVAADVSRLKLRSATIRGNCRWLLRIIHSSTSMSSTGSSGADAIYDLRIVTVKKNVRQLDNLT